MSTTDGWAHLWRVVGSLLSYPIIPTQTRPITVTTLIVVGLLVAVSFWVSHRAQGFLRRRVFPRLRLDPGLEFSIARFAHYAVLTLGLLLGLETLHVDLTGLAVVAGILSVGIGFGLQNVASNFIAGIILLIERPITVGDYVTVGDTKGIIRAINMRSTEIVTRDNVSIIVPNSEFVSGRVVNWSHGDPRLRLRVAVGVSYSSDVAQVSRVLLEVACATPDVLADPPPEVQFTRFGESSLDFELEVWIADPQHEEPVTSSLHYAIRAAFLDNGIEIPFPQRDLNIRPAERAPHLVSNGPTLRPSG
jgi:small-conductance mechanosensitive channel